MASVGTAGSRVSWTPHTEHLTLMRVATREAIFAVSTGRVIVDAVRTSGLGRVALGAGGETVGTRSNKIYFSP